jgi:hypothetical protein
MKKDSAREISASADYERFDSAMDKLLKANLAQVKAAMEQEKKERAEKRKVKRERTTHE